MTLPPSPDAGPVLRAVVGAARDEFGRHLDAVFAVGSLAHGGFAPLVSDVGVLMVLRRITASTAGRVAVIATDVWERVPGPLTGRLSVFWADGDGVRRGGGHGRLPAVDRLDLLRSGRLLAGRDGRAAAVPPTRAELLRETALFALDRFDASFVEELRAPELLLGRGVIAVTKAVLLPVRFSFTLATGRVGPVDDAVTWFRAVGEPASAVALVEAAARWRHDGLPDDRTALGLLAAVAGPYRAFRDGHAAALQAAGSPALAAQLRSTFAVLDQRP